MSDSIKFKKEYEKLNNTKFRNVNIDKNNPFKYKDIKDIVDMVEKKESFIVYFGFSSCPWCRMIIEELVNVSNEEDINIIYYVDIKNIRDEYNIVNNKSKLIKKGNKNYLKLLKLFDNILDDYKINDYNLNEKRIYAPTIISVINGKAEKKESAVEGISDPYKKLTKNEKKEIKRKIKCILTCYKDGIASCSSKTCVKE